MARQRMIKPEFFSSESLADCSFAARLCFIGLWTCADDNGHIKFAPMSLRKELFGLDDVSMEEFIDMCSEFGEQAGMTNEQMREHCSKVFPTLKRWKK